MKAVVPKRASWIEKRLIVLCLALSVTAGCNEGPATNNPPVANAGADQTVTTGASVTLDGSASSDPDGDAITFSWTQTRGASVTLSSTSAAVATFTAPSKGTSVAFELTVSDGQSTAVAKTNVSVHPADALVQVTERRQPSIKDDPAVNGSFPDNWTAPGAPPTPAGPPGTGANQLINQVQFGPLVDEQVPPGGTREVELQVAVPSALTGAVRWIGTSDALQVRLTLDGALLATGTGYSFAANRGGSALQAQTTAGGLAKLSVTNTSAVTVRLRIVLGAIDLSATAGSDNNVEND